jgi:hypothetical protein
MRASRYRGHGGRWRRGLRRQRRRCQRRQILRSCLAARSERWLHHGELLLGLGGPPLGLGRLVLSFTRALAQPREEFAMPPADGYGPPRRGDASARWVTSAVDLRPTVNWARPRSPSVLVLTRPQATVSTSSSAVTLFRNPCGVPVCLRTRRYVGDQM